MMDELSGETHDVKECFPKRERKGWPFTPHVIIFFSSACIMVVEIVAGRLIARHLGSSLYTWTSIIGVVLAGMSIGNYLGGRMADRYNPERSLGLLFLAASLSCVLSLYLNNLVTVSTRPAARWLDRQAKTGAVEVIIDAKSGNTGYALFNEHIQGEDFFNTAAHPTITFKSTKVKFKGEKPVAVEGDLTIKGVTRPVTLNGTSFHAMPHPMLKKDAIGANAVTRIKRSEFNMGKYAPNVSDEVTLAINVEAVKE